MRNTEDYSILAWGLLREPPNSEWWATRDATDIEDWPATFLERRNPLARSPSLFRVDPGWSLIHTTYEIPREDWTKSSVSVGQAKSKIDRDHGPPVMTARGLSISLPLWKPREPHLPWLAYIGCQIRGKPICIPLSPVADMWDSSTSASPASDVFYRISNGHDDYYWIHTDSKKTFKMTRIYIKRFRDGTDRIRHSRKSDSFNFVNIDLAEGFSHACTLWQPPVSLYGWWEDHRELPGFTNDHEVFVIVLSRTGVGILPLDPSTYGSDTPTYEKMCYIADKQTPYSSGSSELIQCLPQSAKALVLELRQGTEIEASHRFKNCIITVGMKRGISGYRFYMTSQITCSKFVLLGSASTPPECPETEEIKKEMQAR